MLYIEDSFLTRTVQSWLPTLVCVLALPLCALWVRPWVEIGIIDDWSYIRSAQVLADTGRIVYNGWATAMLGWQLYFGAALIKLFGFSFTVTRGGTLAVAMATGAVMQRTLLRLGITAWNSAAVTLVMLLSPVFMAVTFSFMSDVYGVLVLIACCYCCVRALQARGKQSAALWVSAAALGNALGGTARQIAWLGLLVMVPCTLLLLRKSRLVLWFGSLSTGAGVVFVAVSLHWFSRQPYALPEHVLPPVPYGIRFFVSMLPLFVRLCVSEMLLLAMPLLLVFTPAMFRTRRALLFSSSVLAFAILLSVYLCKVHKVHKLARLCVPYLYNNLWYTGLEAFQAYLGHSPTVLTPLVRAVLTALLLLGGLGLVSAALAAPAPVASAAKGPAAQGRSLDMRSTCVMLLPCGLVYLLFLLPRHLYPTMLDRYFLFPEFILLVFAALLYQRNLRTHLPAPVWVLIAVLAVLDTGGMHDTFALYRAQLSLLNKLTSQGVQRTAIDGGQQYNSWTQVMVSGYVNDSRIVVPSGAYHPMQEVGVSDPCRTNALDHEPSVRARYVISFDPNACGGPSQVAPVVYSTFFSPHTRTMYAVVGPYGR